MKDKLGYEEPVAEITVFEAGDVITLSKGDPKNAVIKYEPWNGSW